MTPTPSPPPEAEAVELLPCPFCGGAARLTYTGIHGRQYYEAECPECDFGAFDQTTKEGAIASWNRRSDATIRTLTTAREQAEERIEELEQNAEHVSTEFEKDCWVALRALLNACHFDWSADDSVTADDACEYVQETLRSLENDAKRAGTLREQAVAQRQELFEALAATRNNEKEANAAREQAERERDEAQEELSIVYLSLSAAEARATALEDALRAELAVARRTLALQEPK